MFKGENRGKGKENGDGTNELQVYPGEDDRKSEKNEK